MAKKRRTSRSAPKRRRSRSRVGAVNTGMLAEVALVAIGGLGGALVSNQLKGQGETISAAAPLVLGIAATMFVKNPMVKSAALGSCAVGALKLANKFTGGKIGEVVGEADTFEIEMVSGIDAETTVGSDEEIDYSEMMSGASSEANFEV